MGSWWSGVGEFVSRRYGVVLAAGLVATIGVALGIPQLEFETSQDSLIGGDSQVAVDNREFQGTFGGETMVVLFTAEPGHFVEELFAGDNFDQLQAFDAELAELDTVFAGITPLNSAQLTASELGIAPQLFASAEARVRAQAPTQAAADEAAAEVTARLFRDAARLESVNAEAEELGIANPLTFENPAFVRFLLYDNAEETEIRPALRTNFPDPAHAAAVVRLQGNLDIAEMGEGADAVREAAAGLELEGFEVMATGTAVLLQEIDDYLGEGMLTLGALAVGVMILVLFFVFRVRRRLLPLVMVVLGAVAGFGIMGLAGVPLTLITISGLPILIGVGVDFAIQVHSRFEEEIDVDGDRSAAFQRVMRGLGSPLLVVALAAAAGFLALQISQVPQIRDFGVMLAIGIGTLFVAGLMITSALLAQREARKPTGPGEASVPHGVLENAVDRMTSLRPKALVPIAVIGLGVIIAGLVFEGRFTIETEPERWLPQAGEAVQSLEELRTATNTSSDVSLLVEADDVLTDEVTTWMVEFGDAQVQKHEGVLLRHESMAETLVSSITGVPAAAEEIETVLPVTPDPIARSFVSEDRTRAALVFPIADVPLDVRGELLDEMRADLQASGGPDAILAAPEGVRVTPAGIATIAVELVDALEANRQLMTWVALAAVALLLLIAFHGVTKMALPLVPVLIATGLSSVVTFATGISLSPITAVTTPLVIATCTEFSVLIMARYVEERRRGLDPEAAVRHGAVRIGRAFTASGLTTVGGFGVLAFSTFPLLRDFGILVGLNVLVALVSALVVLPPLLIWADRNQRLTGFTFDGSEIDLRKPSEGPAREPATH